MPKDSRGIGGGRLETMNSKLWAPGKPSFTKPYCGKQGSAVTDPIIPSYSRDSDEETEQSPKPKIATRGTAMKKQNNHRNRKNTNEKQLFLKTRNGNNSTGQQCTLKAEEGNYNEATQNGPLTHIKR